MKKKDFPAYIKYDPFHKEGQNGKGTSALKEPVPLPYKRTGDAIITAASFDGGVDNNARITIGRDRDPFGKGKRKKKEFEGLLEDRISQVSGYSDFMGAGAIDIVVGSGAPFPVDLAGLNRPNNLPPLYQTEYSPKLKGSESKLINNDDHPAIMMDAARIYLTQMGDIDDYFDFYMVPGIELDSSPSSGIVLKADRVRMHARRDIKIIAGGDGGYGIDSNGYQISEASGIHLVAGNGRINKKQQPLVLGDNLLTCLNGLYKIVQDNLEITNKLAVTQMTLNTIVSNSIRVTCTGPSAPDPISQVENLMKLLSDMQDLMSTWFQKFVNVPLANEQNFCGPQSLSYILSRHNTTN